MLCENMHLGGMAGGGWDTQDHRREVGHEAMELLSVWDEQGSVLLLKGTGDLSPALCHFSGCFFQCREIGRP